MARRRKRNRDNSTPIARRQPDYAVFTRPLLSPVNLREIEDRRLFDPTADLLPARTIYTREAGKVTLSVGSKPVVRSRMRKPAIQDILKFKVPREVTVCVRRKQRREVLHALQRTTSGRGRSKRRNAYSDYSCK